VESQSVAMARREEDLGALQDDPLWKAPAAPPGVQPWTDDFASLLAAFRWGSSCDLLGAGAGPGLPHISPAESGWT
jgi:hypothetical protein